jgi:hypothetical protein
MSNRPVVFLVNPRKFDTILARDIGKVLYRTYLKNVFWPPASGGIGPLFQILNIQQYASGLKLGSAAILNQNPIFEIGSK